ncbi:BTAD domain-containing putative transcriptional regulator [Leptolyngbya sp. 7M]|uniref:AfsR/SARP family transcriptional regulator n=1 Tax=Leptolyngbya sp. 7M TaxID=2812896 RepID=UPI001B8C2705|nr:BTAD domain-containing putative transcriptional regulator [Leptolyngbya sp. 7M]QYO68341.1 hypothetical protein JVX88_17175 [Leptolyngbya sp. 7M]
MIDITLNLLGPIEATLNGQQITFPYEKLQVLLAYLMVESNRRHHRQHLASLLWTDQDEADARSNLRKALYILRRLLNSSPSDAPLFFATRNTVQFNFRGNCCRLDTIIFTEQIHSYHQYVLQPSMFYASHISNLEQAIALYRGPFLGQVRLPDSKILKDWVMLHRQCFHQLAMDACTKLIGYYESRHQDKAQYYTQRQHELEGWNETTHQHLTQTSISRKHHTLQQGNHHEVGNHKPTTQAEKAEKDGDKTQSAKKLVLLI